MNTVIRAQVPMSEMLTYEQHLTSATGGRGSYHMEYSHYEEVPQHLQNKIIAAAKAERGQEVAEEAGRVHGGVVQSLCASRVMTHGCGSAVTNARRNSRSIG